MQILLVENSEGVIKMLLQHLGTKYQIKTAKSLASCLAALETPPLPDAVLLDLQLGDATGLTAVKVLQEKHPNVPIVVFTGTMAKEDAEQAIEMGAQDFLTKPVDLPLVEDALRKAVARHRVRSEFKPIMGVLQELKGGLESP